MEQLIENVSYEYIEYGDEKKDRLNLRQFTQTSYSAKREQISIYVENPTRKQNVPADCGCSCR